MEQILEQLQKLNEKIDALPAASREGGTVLIDGKAALNAKEASKLTGVREENLKEMARVGRVPGLGRTSISKYEKGHPIPENLLDLIIEALNDPRLTLIVRGRITRSYLA